MRSFFNNRLLFSLLFLEFFVGGQGLGGMGKGRDRGDPQPPTRESPSLCLHISVCFAVIKDGYYL